MAPTFPDLLDLDALLSTEERDIRAAARSLVDDQVRPHVADWYESGEVPARELAIEFGKAGLLGMHLNGYGCAGASAVAYGLACLELEAGDSGVRSLVSRAGLAGHVRDLALRLRGAEAAVAARHGRRRADRLLRADRARPRLRPGLHAHPGPPRRRRLGARRQQDVDHQRPVADVPVIWARTERGEVHRGFVVPTDTPGVTAREISHKLSLRASAPARSCSTRCGCPPAELPEATGLKAPLSCLTEARYGIVWGALGAARDCLAHRASTTPRPGAVRPADRRLPAHPGQARRHGR